MVPLIVSADEWSRLEEGLIQRTQTAQPDPARSARSAAPAAERLAAAVAGAGEPVVSSARVTAFACRATSTCTCTASTWRARRMASGGARRSHAGAVGRRLRAREPARPPAQPAGSLSRNADSAAGFFLSRAARHVEHARAEQRAARQSRAADAGTATTRRTSSTRTWRDISASRSSRARDLTVRDRRVFIKTLEGLQPVNVIFRRLDDSFCDPLELRGDSFLGVAGLVDAVRAGNVVVANALGSGVIETAAILPFLPALCRHLLGEELQLPSVADLVVRTTVAAVSTCSSISTISSSSRHSPQKGRTRYSDESSAGVSEASSPRPFARGRRTLSPRRTSSCRARRSGIVIDSSRDPSCFGHTSPLPATHSR